MDIHNLIKQLKTQMTIFSCRLSSTGFELKLKVLPLTLNWFQTQANVDFLRKNADWIFIHIIHNNQAKVEKWQQEKIILNKVIFFFAKDYSTFNWVSITVFNNLNLQTAILEKIAHRMILIHMDNIKF